MAHSQHLGGDAAGDSNAQGAATGTGNRWLIFAGALLLQFAIGAV